MEQSCSNINTAIIDGDLDCAERLIEQVDLNAADELGRAPLHLAAERGYPGLVALLLEAGIQTSPTTAERRRYTSRRT